MTDKKKALRTWAPIIIFGIAFLLRIIYINTAFWYDEACSWFTAKQTFPMGIMDNLLHLDLQHTPIYFFLLHFWMKLFGESEIAIRSLSLIFGVLTVPMVYIISNKLFENNKLITLSTTLITAVSPILVFFSVEARMYPMCVFLVLLSLNFLIDFEKTNDKKSLAKLVLINVLIPYTLVGGIFYNIALAVCYGIYLYKSKKDVLKTYLKGLTVEICCLIPYFALLVYYAKLRTVFVISHEGDFAFWQMVEVLRNFFAPSIVTNPYWPTLSSYDMTPELVFLIMVPGMYFLYGLYKGLKNSSGFFRALSLSIIGAFVLSLLVAICQVNVFTMRYILYLLAPMFIIATYGLATSLSKKHLIIFLAVFSIAATTFDIKFSKLSKVRKHMALASVLDETKELRLNQEDMVIAPFASDAPYYFRNQDSARMPNFDFHKEVRNPYNNRYYDKNQQDLMSKKAKYGLIYDAMFTDKCFSDTFVDYFISTVNNKVNSGRFVLIALYGEDGEQLIPLEEIRSRVKTVTDIKDSTVKFMLHKYLYDIVVLLEQDFTFLNTYKKDNFTYLLYQKK